MMTAVRRQGHFFVSMGLVVGASGFQSLQPKYGSLVVLYLPGSYSGHAFEIDKPWVCTPTTTRLTLQSSLLSNWQLMMLSLQKGLSILALG